MLQFLNKTLILVHRYLGIPLSVLLIVWFVSGIVMMYAGGMPQLSAGTRLDKLPELDLAAVSLSPAQAVERAGGRGPPGRVTLTTVLERPAYRVGLGRTTTVFADDGSQLGELTMEQALGVAARFAGAAPERVAFDRTVSAVDQWTLTLRGQLPLHLFNVDDGAGTRVYVSPRSGEVALATTTKDRALAWAGTIPHWLYFTPLRTNQPLWYWTVVWLSAAGCLLAVIGLVLGITQLKRSRPLKLSIPYRGWMRWHHVLGLVFGVFALTWVFSGLLSMEPFAWTNATGMSFNRDPFPSGPLEVERYQAFDAAAWRTTVGEERRLKEVELLRIQGEPYYSARYTLAATAQDPARERLHQPYSSYATPSGRGRLLIAAETLEVRTEPFSVESLLTPLREAANGGILESELLTGYDAYYYSQDRQAPLPVLRVKFDDPAQTWIYVDPETSQIVGQLHRLARLERWLFNGLHSLDFGFWYDKRPLWDIGMIALSLGALAVTAIGLLLGVRRLRRDTTRGLRRLGLGGGDAARDSAE